jgi:hypothetical protein
MSKSTTVTLFLQPLIQELKTKTDVPILLPTYFPDFSHAYYKYPTAKTQITKDEYNIYLLAFQESFPPNDPRIDSHSLSNELGTLSGSKEMFQPFSKPNDYIPFKKIKNISTWIEPKYEMSLYGKYKNWTFIADGVGEKNAAKELTRILINEMSKFDWLQKNDIVEGNIYVSGAPESMRININWKSSTGFSYDVSYQGSLEETLKILSSMKKIN